MLKSKFDDPQSIYFAEVVLKSIYKEARENGEIIWPDEAFKKFMDGMNKIVSSKMVDIDEVYLKYPSFNPVKISSKIHHYAVEMFYKTYLPTPKGRPPLSDKYLDKILSLNQEGKSHLESAKILNDLPSDLKEDKVKAKDRVRKRKERAEKRNTKNPK